MDMTFEKLLEIAILQERPIVIRYPKAQAISTGPINDRNYYGSRYYSYRTDGYFIAIGSKVNTCIKVAKNLQNIGISIGVIDIRWIKPLELKYSIISPHQEYLRWKKIL
jgi:deoxyxylulose-5-phosphate synthase